MMIVLKKLLSDESGAMAIEYGLIASIISVGAIGGISSMGGSLFNNFTTISNSLR
jgi:pilus assembly protein Flp/PilA